MAEYIEKAAAVAIATYAEDEHPYDKDPKRPDTYSAYNEGWTDACDYIRARIEALSAADVAQVRHGRWDKVGYGLARCSFCHTVRKTDFDRDHYCPNCGAKMDGEEAAEDEQKP